MDLQHASWQQQLAGAFTDLEQLCAYLGIPPLPPGLSNELRHFPLRVPYGYAELIEKGNCNDPLLRQILPVTDELLQYSGFLNDPVGDLQAVVEPGVIHKYQSRVLLIVTGGCAVHCRYCFRRNFPYGEMQLSQQKLDTAIDYINAHDDIREVILSGGDPLLLNDSKIGTLFNRINNIAHIARIRIHSRVPVVLPARVTDDLLTIFQGSRATAVLILHANHHRELSEAVSRVCHQLLRVGVRLLNQSVLLKGVNDSSDTICELSNRLFALGVLPYYLHLLDKASGTGHFEVSEPQALSLMREVKRQLPGYLVPKLVREQAGAPFKITIG